MSVTLNPFGSKCIECCIVYISVLTTSFLLRNKFNKQSVATIKTMEDFEIKDGPICLVVLGMAGEHI